MVSVYDPSGFFIYESKIPGIDSSLPNNALISYGSMRSRL